MIQRKQTVLMLASVIAILMMLVMPLGTIESADAYFNLSGLGINSVTDGVPLDRMSYDLVGILLCMFTLPLVCIFLFNKRKVQLRILIYTAVLDLLFYAYFFFYEGGVLEGMATSVLSLSGYSTEVSSEYTYTLYVMPALSAFCCVMAIKGVLYDIALLASADRLRPSRK